MTKQDTIRWVGKPIVFLLCLVPLMVIVWRIINGDVGTGLNANPVETVNRYLGDWALRFILITLSITPLVKLSNWTTPVRFRRMLGLFAFAYATLHLSNYVIADQFFNWSDIWADIVKRVFITVGMATFVILAALAVTSPKAMVKKMGAKRWRMLHRSVYVAALGGVFHYWMMVKADLIGPIIHAAILGLLLGYRLLKSRNKPPASTRRSARLQIV
ncbi:MAG: sulfoxide reductase heme-binding subunit YedZ [Rhodospirillales bacterium]|nr:sulfoxide reductase heme-binding subunit YedZ [Rhodospirillales bacterium]